MSADNINDFDLNSPKSQSSSSSNDANSSWDTWYTQYSNDMESFLSALAQFNYMCDNHVNPGTILLFAMTVMFPDKMKISQDTVSEQAYAIQDLSEITNMISQLQNDLQTGNYQEYCEDYGRLAVRLSRKPGGSGDSWLQNHSGEFTGSYTDPNGVVHKQTVDFNFGGILGNPSDPNSSINTILEALGQDSDNGKTSGTGLGELTKYTTFVKAYYNLTGKNINPDFPFIEPPNPSEAQSYVNAFSQMTSQVSSASSFSSNMLQYQQQDYQRLTQSVANSFESWEKLVEKINQNISST